MTIDTIQTVTLASDGCFHAIDTAFKNSETSVDAAQLCPHLTEEVFDTVTRALGRFDLILEEDPLLSEGVDGFSDCLGVETRGSWEDTTKTFGVAGSCLVILARFPPPDEALAPAISS
ncbi:hypothetical protein BFJ69_g16175 [Fusarium oxysporum]|uniref:Uncharacterized protein n=1 Tax=Fusarium oxysporum TaxID=5507 RepID=A0A420MBY0_FUSOX|nr:hypothetical protein BFJ69_g16175 [Fusarium oxysporum]